MFSKGKQISVIIAGATGILGQEIVSRLVSHPDVSRVVALARYPIPVNRWTSVFPHLHIGDARRYLSVVPVEWEKILADASHIPRSYVSDGVWRFDDADAEWKKFEQHRKRASRSARAPKDADAAYHTKASGQPRSGSDAATPNSSAWLSSPPQGYVKMPIGWPAGDGSLSGAQGHDDGPHGLLDDLPPQERRAANLSSTFDPTLSSAGAKGHGSCAGDTARRRLSQEFLRQLLQNSFYRSVFSGHQVAINCIGTSHVLSSGELTLVDYDLSMAFAKIVRLFNCMAHAEPTEDEERLLVETTSRELDSVLWNEIYSACYGKSASRDPRTAFAEEKTVLDASKREGRSRPLRGGDRNETAAAATASSEDADDSYKRADVSQRNKEKAQWMNRGQVATLRHFSQVSVRAANEHSPLPYLRTHGKRDRDLLVLFNRWKGPLGFASRGLNLMKPFSKTSVQFGRPVLVTPPPSSILPAWVGVPEFLHRILFGSAPHSFGDVIYLQNSRGPRDADSGEEAKRPTVEEIARKRAQMLLRRDVVKIWEQSNVTIWRPGVFERPGRRRLMERLLSLVERPVNVKCLAECIVDDIVDSLYNLPLDNESSRERRMGKTKVINGSSVARRTYMKALEDGLDERDTQRTLQARK
jgi:hypothetical protein